MVAVTDSPEAAGPGVIGFWALGLRAASGRSASSVCQNPISVAPMPDVAVGAESIV